MFIGVHFLPTSPRHGGHSQISEPQKNCREFQSDSDSFGCRGGKEDPRYRQKQQAI